VLAACALSHDARAQAPVWHGSVEGSANVLFGAARGRVIAGAVGASRTDSILELRADFRTTYADARAEDGHREVTARAPRASMGLDYRPYARVSPFWFGAIESSLQQRIASRWETGAGAKLTLQRKGDDDLSVSLALLVDRTRALRPDSATPRAVTNERWSLRFRVRRQLTDAVRLTHVTFYQPAIDRPGRYTAETTTGLAIALASKLALTATLRDRYDSEARARGARSNHDGQLLFGAKASY
jgi:hypothetical protein